MTPLLEVSGLSKRFGDFSALDGVGFEVRPGEVLGLIGPNGAGKTTLLECVAGLQDCGGTFTVEGLDLPAARRKEKVFYVPDGTVPCGQQSVQETLGLFGGVYGVGAAAQERVAAGLGLGPTLGKRAAALSKGTLKRLLLGVGLLTPQPLLLLDEPFDGLDLRQTRSVMDLLKDVQRLPRTLLLSIHQLADAERVCDRFLLLREGRLLGCGTLPELRAKAGLESGDLTEVFLALT